MKGLDIESKSVRVASYHRKTVENALDIIGAMGVDGPSHVRADHIMKRVTVDRAVSFAELYPQVASGDLLRGTGSPFLLKAWEEGVALNKQAAARRLSKSSIRPENKTLQSHSMN
jgi:hypothetical protein